jgi:hypothetical protein
MGLPSGSSIEMTAPFSDRVAPPVSRTSRAASEVFVRWIQAA